MPDAPFRRYQPLRRRSSPLKIAVAAWYPSRYNASDPFRVSILNYVAAPFKNVLAEFIAK